MSKNRRAHQNNRPNRLPNGQFPPGKTGNPNGRARLDGKPANKSYSAADVKSAVNEALSEARLDGWYSMISSLGTDADKSTGGAMEVVPVQYAEARMIYRGDSFGARIAEARPREMFRAGWTLKISDAQAAKQAALETADGEPQKLSRKDARKLKRRLDAMASKTKDLAERVMNRARDLKVNHKFKRALTLANVDGGCAILIGAQDRAKDWKLPLNVDALRTLDQLKWLTVIEKKNLQPVAWYTDPLAEKYGEVAIWRINPNLDGAGRGVDPKYVPKVIDVHESRLILFQGIKLTDGEMPGCDAGFGDSIYTRLKGTLSRYSLGWNAAAILLNEFSIAVMKIKGLSEMASQDGKKKLMTRMAAVQLGRSVARLTLLDKEEELTRDTATITGLSELLFALMQEMAGEADVPVTILMGMSPAGLNATGESDIRGWYDRIASEWNDQIDPKLRYLLSLFLRCLNNGKEPEKWSVDLNSLWQESAKEKAETAKIWADVDSVNTTTGVYSVEEARRSRYQGDEFGTEIVIDGDSDGALEMAGEGDPDMEEAKKMAGEGALDPNAPAPKPGEPAPKSSGGTAAPIAGEKPASNAAFTGVQVTAMIETVKAVINGEIPRESGKAILLGAGLAPDDAAAEAMLGPVNFEPKKEDPPAMPFGAPPHPGAPPMPPGKQPPAPPAPEDKPAEKKPPFPPKKKGE